MESQLIKTGSLKVSVALFFLILRLDSIQPFYCNEQICEVETASYNTPCQAVPNCTDIGFRTFLDPSKCNCCEYCFDYLKENDICDTSSHQKPTHMCGPHLKCQPNSKGDEARCQRIIDGPTEFPGETIPKDPNFCMRRKYEYEMMRKESKLGIAQVNPDCDAGGYYAPRQCLPGSVCYCSGLNGERIFGLTLPEENQDCACARDVARLQEFGFKGKFPHCLPNGDYDELQCVVRTCYCRSHPEKKFALHELANATCYDPKIHPDPKNDRYYVRDCELERARIDVQIGEAELQGTKMIVADKPVCDPDGNFAPIQSDFDILYCAMPKDGSPIENFHARKFSAAARKMNCYCARARHLLQNSATGKPKCCLNGNYKPWQCKGRKCYCVDELGRQKHWLEEKDEKNIRDLDCYPKDSVRGVEPDCVFDDVDSVEISEPHP